MTFRIGTLRFAVFSVRNMIFMLAVLAMNYTLMRPSPVDMLYILSFLTTLAHIALSENKEVSRRAVLLTLLLGAWAVSYILASLPHVAEKNVTFELLAKSFAISIGVVAAFVSMSWTRRHFERFMAVYIVSCSIASILGTIGFVLQNPALTWDGRARALIDDPNMYGSFLLPAIVFSLYFLFRPGRHKLLLAGALGLLLLGVLLSFSRIATVAAMVCVVGYVVFHNRRRPDRLLMMAGGLIAVTVLLVAVASVVSQEFTAKLMDRLTFAKSYDLGEEGRYHRYVLVLPMILTNPVGVGVLQLEKIFPEPIHNIWLSSFVNYGWVAGFAWITLVVATIIVSVLNYRRTRDEIVIALLFSIIGIVMCSTLHEGEHWRHMWLTYGLIWGLCAANFPAPPKQAPRRRGHWLRRFTQRRAAEPAPRS